jgi:hypothetical protein
MSESLVTIVIPETYCPVLKNGVYVDELPPLYMTLIMCPCTKKAYKRHNFSNHFRTADIHKKWIEKMNEKTSNGQTDHQILSLEKENAELKKEVRDLKIQLTENENEKRIYCVKLLAFYEKELANRRNCDETKMMKID